MRNYVRPAYILAVMLLSACSKFLPISTKTPAPYPPGNGVVKAGIAQTDLTPPPGYPMNGFSLNGRIAHGCWIRPKATALYMQDAAGTPFVFVTTDLWGITEGQKLKVLELLADDSSTKFIGESELLLAATHSHHSLGVNVPDDAFALSSIGIGFDTAAFYFTVRQIVSAIKTAVNSASAAQVTFASSPVNGIAKNRSVKAYLRNNPQEREQYFGHPPAAHFEDLTKNEIQSMIENRLSLIVVKDLQQTIKGILASYPVHPTSTGDQTEVYSADVFGLASWYASQEMPGHPLIAFYNGAEGDVAPDYVLHNRHDAFKIARLLSDGIKTLSGSAGQLSMNGSITHRSEVIKITSSKVEYDPLDVNCYCTVPGAMVSTSGEAIVGAGVFAGASDGSTFFHAFGFTDGIKSDECDAEQGRKLPAARFLFSNVFGQLLPVFAQNTLSKGVKTNPPTEYRVSIHQAGNIIFTAIPGEFTTMLGRRIRKTVAQRFNTDENKISLVGLADGYVSYVTTPCEYGEQAYEGASDYYGTSTGEVFVKVYDRLSRKQADRPQDRMGAKKKFKTGHWVEFGPAHLGKLQVWSSEEDLQNLLVSNSGQNLHSHFIPPSVLSGDTVLIDADEAAAYSFEDTVNVINSHRDFYPSIYLLNEFGDTLTTPEHILTIDKYADFRCTWTVRFPDMSALPSEAVQVSVKTLCGDQPYVSTFFRRR